MVKRTKGKKMTDPWRFFTDFLEFVIAAYITIAGFVFVLGCLNVGGCKPDQLFEEALPSYRLGCVLSERTPDARAE